MENLKFESLSDNNDDGHAETIVDALKIWGRNFQKKKINRKNTDNGGVVISTFD